MSARSRIVARSQELDTPSRGIEQQDYQRSAVRLVRQRVAAPTSARRSGETELDLETRPASLPRGFGSVLRIIFGFIWLADVYFKWQPSFLNGLVDVMHDGSVGQPDWLVPWFNLTHAVIAAQPTLWAYGIAVVETGIAFALILGFARKMTYVGGALYSVIIWATAEGFGRTSGIATDIGTAIIYAIAFLALLAVDQCDGTRRYSLDAVIERRLPWWRRIAEVGS